MIKAKAYTKFNLNLHIIPDIVYKNRTGYYPIHFINCELNLHDELSFIMQKNKIDLICDNKELSNKKNVVYKTALLLKHIVKDNTLGVKITLKKNIPVRAGLGGGSSDAAVTLHSLMKLWHITLNNKQINYLNRQIGTDVHYCYKGGVCEVKGRGDENTCVYMVNKKCLFHNKQCSALHNSDKACYLSRVPRIWVILIVPEKQKQSTAWMYNNIDISRIGKHTVLCDALKQSLYKKDKQGIIKSIFNDFEYKVIENNEEMLELERKLSKMEADKICIAGSGPTVVGLFASKKKSIIAFQQLKNLHNQVIWTYTK